MNEDYQNWCADMKSRRGLWTIDPVHDGVHRDLIAFCPDRIDATKGVFVTVSGPTVTCGDYEGALPHIGDALFYVKHGFSVLGGTQPDQGQTGKPSNEAAKIVFERLGVRFLVEALCL